MITHADVTRTYTNQRDVTPYLQAEATPGVWGGLVAVYRPGDAWCWVCVQHFLDDEADDTLPAPPQGNMPDVQPPGCAAPTYTGAGFDLANIAMHAVRLAVAELTGGDGYGQFPNRVFTVRLRDEAGRPVAVSWTEHQLRRHPDCQNHLERPAAESA